MIPESYFKRFFWRSPYIKVKERALSAYLSILMDDPQLEYKPGFLERTGKWKRQYQDGEQSPVRVNFYLDDRDRGRLSAVAHATGFSMCYIFVYLMPVSMGVLSLENKETQSVRVTGIP